MEYESVGVFSVNSWQFGAAKRAKVGPQPFKRLTFCDVVEKYGDPLKVERKSFMALQ